MVAVALVRLVRVLPDASVNLFAFYSRMYKAKVSMEIQYLRILRLN